MNRPIPVLLPVVLLAAVGSLAAQDERNADAPRTLAASSGRPIELQLTRAGSASMDLRLLPQTPPQKQERPEREPPEPSPVELPGGPAPSAPVAPGPSAPAPAPNASFDGLDFASWGAGHPPDTNGDVGPTYYIQSINSSIGVYRKSDTVRVAAFTFNTFMSQGAFGNLCDTNNFGDPVVLYDTFEGRWVITDFAFTLDGSGNVINPPGSFQCFAVSKTEDPVLGGWNFYSINTAGGLGDYPKFGVWPDGIYMSANMFDFAAAGSFQNPRVYALNKAQMYAGSPTVQVVTFDAPSSDFTILPSNARLQAGTPPPGTPNYFVSTWQFLNGLSVYKFHVDWARTDLSTLTGPDVPLAGTSWPSAAVANALSLGGNALDVLQIRAMMQNQYSNIGGVESLWATHTVRRGDTAGLAAPRWYQVNVTGGAVAASLPQAATWDPDGANVINRFMPSLAVDRAGDIALGYSTSDTTTKPAIKYAGRLSSDPINTLAQTEQVLIQGTGTQTGNCGGGACARWGDYSAMSLDPDGCTFWYTNEYYAADGLSFLTRIGSFAFPSCTPVGAGGTVTGTVTATTGGAPISGATVALGSRTTTTDGSGAYQFVGIPAGSYPSLDARAAGFDPSPAVGVVVTDGGTATQDFALGTAPASACPTDTTQADFQTGEPTSVDLTTAPGDVTLPNAPSIDQQNTTITTSGFGFTSTSWAGQTFTAGVSGQLTRVDLDLFCSLCTGTTPNITVSIRATTGAPAVPTGADLATATIAGFNSGAGGYFSANLGTPLALAAGTQYAVIVRAVSNPSAGTYAYVCSCTSPNSNPYANGQRVTSANSGASWTADTTSGGRDLGFKLYVSTGFASSGNLVSSLKDANPAVGLSPSWSTLSWTAATPANTTLQFQVAASGASAGPFSFVGPDGTAATFFTTSGASLAQFDGNRYLKYKAYLTTTDSTATPTLNDVTVCFANAAPLTPPDLSLTKSDGGASVAPGGTVAYTLTYSNTGGQGSTGVVLTDTVPANTTFNAGASTVGWVCVPNNNAGSTCTLAVGAVAAPSGPLTATFAVTVVDPVGAGVTQISNTASIADDGTHGADPTPGNNTGSDTTPVTGAPDLSLTKSDGGASVAPGGTAAYTLTYANAGNRGATGVVLTETVPANTTFNAGASTVGWVCVPNNNAGSTCSLAIGAVAAGSGPQTATFAVTAANPVAAGVTQISNTASVADDGANGTDPIPGNNTGNDTTPVTGAPDLSLTKSDGGASVAPGGTVAYTLTYANAGNRGATGVVLTETVPANTTFNAGASTVGWVCVPNNNAGSTCTLAIGAVAAGSGLQIATFAVTAANPVAAGVTQISNTASVADDGANGTDPTPGNNTGADTTPVTGAPDLSLTKSDGGASVAPGGTVAYTLTYANLGNRDATGVVLTETVPANTTFNAGASTAGWVCVPGNNAGSTCTLAIGTLVAASGNQTATFAATVDNPLAGGVSQIDNTASIADDGTQGADPAPGNNSASDTTPVLAGLYYTVAPCRLLDTRGPAGLYGGPALSALSTRTFVAAGQCGVPAEATALSFNITVTLSTAAGDLRVYPGGIPSALVSVINYAAGQTRANNGLTALGAAGDFIVQSDQPSGTVEVILDVNGYIR
jgi:uncharacterized repeat protein (TIGR01451 family)